MPINSKKFNKGTRLLLMAAVLCLFIQSGLVRTLEIGAVRLYQWGGRPFTAPISHCRYKPSCSNYALQCLEQDGFWRGNLKLGKRLLMCSPIGWAIDKMNENEADKKTKLPQK